MPELTVVSETWPMAGTFTISRGSRTHVEVVLVELRDGPSVGRGECVPYPRYGESVDGVMEQLRGAAAGIEGGWTRSELAREVPPGAARNALDCALWDLEAGRRGTTVHELAGRPAPGPLTTAYTLSLGAPEAMGAAATAESRRPLLKLKLAGDGGDVDRVRAVREGAPESRLIVDANEGCTADGLPSLMDHLAGLGVALIEQPLPADEDGALAVLEHPVPLCADESCHTAADLRRLRDRYEAVNIKLDKTGGLTAALELEDRAREAGLRVMVGCMVGTSLAMAPAVLAAQGAEWVDLDGPLLLARDREPGLRYEGSTVEPAAPELWGFGGRP
ncbi:MAG: dipeptide epimerase [Gemmatimonadaceae bacterium]|nr:dipeptide epimerase [Gemmatimonadaceae bacterium]